MKDLTQQFDEFIEREFGKIKAELKKDAQRLLDEGIKIFKGFVPIDTQELQNNINGKILETNSGYELIIEVPSKDLSYGINSIRLGLILERGRGKNGVRLKRTQGNTYAGIRTPTQDWFKQATDSWFYLSDQILEG